MDLLLSNQGIDGAFILVMCNRCLDMTTSAVNGLSLACNEASF